MSRILPLCTTGYVLGVFGFLFPSSSFELSPLLINNLFLALGGILCVDFQLFL
ncbi:uncharacterized protein F4812DRAFT_438625 [Daldinia caldariorum]|uniref:uncharacterized protein n=1 Tax=Daldinia caldariorum TaxID=326644 RepID=UPI002007C5E6|nr:uncharacterized protein F4812DRAFT_438625 [Daldinia caldariorum]KAI1465414.1 hypothetical protein F4812DRAFT_438625 [Daldinia caldariorum]